MVTLSVGIGNFTEVHNSVVYGYFSHTYNKFYSKFLVTSWSKALTLHWWLFSAGVLNFFHWVGSLLQAWLLAKVASHYYWHGILRTVGITFVMTATKQSDFRYKDTF